MENELKELFGPLLINCEHAFLSIPLLDALWPTVTWWERSLTAFI